jgi:hypothetical protein
MHFAIALPQRPRTGDRRASGRQLLQSNASPLTATFRLLHQHRHDILTILSKQRTLVACSRLISSRQCANTISLYTAQKDHLIPLTSLVAHRAPGTIVLMVVVAIEWELNQTDEPTEALGLLFKKTCDPPPCTPEGCIRASGRCRESAIVSTRSVPCRHSPQLITSALHCPDPGAEE